MSELILHLRSPPARTRFSAANKSSADIGSVD